VEKLNKKRVDQGTAPSWRKQKGLNRGGDRKKRKEEPSGKKERGLQTPRKSHTLGAVENSNKDNAWQGLRARRGGETPMLAAVREKKKKRKVDDSFSSGPKDKKNINAGGSEDRERRGVGGARRGN